MSCVDVAGLVTGLCTGLVDIYSGWQGTIPRNNKRFPWLMRDSVGGDIVHA